MVLTFIAGFAATFGAAEGIRAAQNKSRREEHRTRKNNLIVHCAKGSKHSALLEGRRVVLAGSKLYIDTGTEYNVPFGHPFEGYFLPYPSQPFPGLVSTITHEAPIMNWVFVHAGTHELRFGPRAASEGNATGPWDCTRQDKRLTFSGWEGFCAVQEGDFWALYFDRDGDRLEGKVSAGTPVVELELLRVEMRVKKPVVEEMSEEEKVKERERREVEAREQAERATNLRAQEEVLREAIRRAQGNGQGRQGGSYQESESPDRPAQRTASPLQAQTHPEQQAQPQSTTDKLSSAPNTNERRKSLPTLNLAPAGSSSVNGSSNENRNANGKRNGRALKESSYPLTPTSRNGSTRSESRSEASGSASPSERQSPSGANARRRRGGGSSGRGTRSAGSGNAGAGRGGGRNGRSSGSSDATPPSSGGSSPPSSYPSDKELPASADVD